MIIYICKTISFPLNSSEPGPESLARLIPFQDFRKKIEFANGYEVIKVGSMRFNNKIVLRFTVGRDQRDISHIPWQICVRSHHEKYCPKAKELEFWKW
jgi:hypothetical protein